MYSQSTEIALPSSFLLLAITSISSLDTTPIYYINARWGLGSWVGHRAIAYHFPALPALLPLAGKHWISAHNYVLRVLYYTALQL
jgi:hypothetical protein